MTNNRNRNRNHQSTAPKAAATDGQITFDHKGQTYTIDPAEKWSLDALEAFEDGKVIRAVREILGDAAWTRFKTKNGKLHGPDFGEMLDAIAAACGIQGN